MNVSIYSKESVEKLIFSGDFPENVLVISFYNPPNKYGSDEPVDYSGVCDDVVYVAEYDFDLSYVEQLGRTYEDFFENVHEVAERVYEAYRENRDIICQCEYGQSRSAACAAAIREHFFHDGINIFSDYRYCPNQLVYHKVINALDSCKKNGK